MFLPPAGAADQPVKAAGLALLVDSLRAEFEQERRQSADRTAALLERAAKAEGQVLELHNALADLAGRLDRAEARLAMPWWRRLMG